MFLQLLSNLQSAEDRCFGTVAKNERAAIASRQAQQFSLGLSFPDFFSAANNLLQPLNLFALFVNEQLRVTDNVDEQDVPDLEFQVGGLLGWHGIFYYLKTRDLTS